MVLKAPLDAEITLIDREAIRAIEQVLTRAGVEFVENSGGAGVRLRKTKVAQ